MHGDGYHTDGTPYLSITLPHNTTGSTSFRVTRKWRSFSRMQRNFIVMMAVVTFVALSYFYVSNFHVIKNISKIPVHRIRQSPRRTPFDQDFDEKEQKSVDFDQVDEMKKKEGDMLLEGLPNAVIKEPKYPKFKGPQNERQRAVVDAFKFAWKGYKKYAWGHDHLKPLSKSYSEWFGLGLTIVDSLDTMIIMSLDEEFEEARKWVAESLTFEKNVFVNFFETSIRILGGLLSAYHLSGEKIFMEKAEDLGKRLLTAYTGSSPIPVSDVNLKSKSVKQPPGTGDSSLSEVTTVQLEFRDLSRVTGNSTFESVTFATSEHIHKLGCEKYDGLCGMFLDPKTGTFRGVSTITVGARADSYYEYLLKQWLQTGKKIDWLKDDYVKAIAAMQKYLIRESEPNKLTFIGEILPTNVFSPKMDHLACFLAGTLALGTLNELPSSHLELGEALGNGCQRMYQTPTGLWPEIVYFNTVAGRGTDILIKEMDAHCLLRPEAIEAWFYLYRATKKKKYQEWGWKAFEALLKHAKVKDGFSSVSSVKRIPVFYRDMMESFFLAETLKYLYLLFDDEGTDIPLDAFVFNSEGHPLPIYDH